MGLFNRLFKNNNEKSCAENTDVQPNPPSEQQSDAPQINENEQYEEPASSLTEDEITVVVEPGGKKEDTEAEKATYIFPPTSLLDSPTEIENSNAEAEVQSNADKLKETFSLYGVDATITDIIRGPSITRYEVKPAPGVRINKITGLEKEIALVLAADGLRIVAPIPGKAAIGIDVPKKVATVVTLKEVIESDEFQQNQSKLNCVLGKGVAGEVICADLSMMPHLLIAGTTGSGKSVCINSLLMSILFKASPDEVKFILIDPKMVEFSKYKGIPHLLIPVVSDVKKASGAFAWAVNEMQTRYKRFSECHCKDIDSYNKLIESNIEYMRDNPPIYNEETGEEEQLVLEVNGLPVDKEKMPRIVIVIDEFADLMMTAPDEVEDSIVRLAQLSRAAGMHLVVATQHPTSGIITASIKANISSRIALKVASHFNSQTILGVSGAEKLRGHGDMLYFPFGAFQPIRVQGCLVKDEEIERVTSYIKKSFRAQYNEEVEEHIKRIAVEELQGGAGYAVQNTVDGIELDSVMEEAIKYVFECGQASTSMIQRRFKVGYARAGRMIDDMEQLGIIEPPRASQPRKVIMTYGQWLEKLSNLKG